MGAFLDFALAQPLVAVVLTGVVLIQAALLLLLIVHIARVCIDPEYKGTRRDL